MTFSALYLFAIVAINIGFEHVPMVALPGGELWPPMSLAVGIIFVLRDYAQREIGHRVLLLMVIGAILSYVMATPAIAAASLAAYIVSETTDWAVYTFTGWEFDRRVFWSSMLSAPVDSAIFLWAIGVHSVAAVLLMTASKWIGICALLLLKRRIPA